MSSRLESEPIFKNLFCYSCDNTYKFRGDFISVDDGYRCGMCGRLVNITQAQLVDNYNQSIKGLRISPITAKKTSTKHVKLGIPGECIDTWIDCGFTIKKETSRFIPDEGSYIIISDTLNNCPFKLHKYFIPFEDFSKRYVMMDGTRINNFIVNTFERTTVVKAIGEVIAYTALLDDTPSGLYENPPSWGKGVATGADQEGYWMASTERLQEWYFMPLTHFNRDYMITS